jgi:hypothetical protein
MANYAPPVPVTQALISDFDGEAGLSVVAIMPAGVWGADVDPTGTLQLDSFKVEPCGTTGNGFHFHGAGHTGWGADAAAAIVSQLQPVDVSTYSGISFVLKSTNGLLLPVSSRCKTPTAARMPEVIMDLPANTDVSDDCYPGTPKPSRRGDTAQVVMFSDLTQQGWGYRPPGHDSVRQAQPRQHRDRVHRGRRFRRLPRRHQVRSVSRPVLYAEGR